MSTREVPNDIELMQRINAKDSAALELLYDRYSPVVYNLVKKIVTDKELSEELVEEIFELIWTRINFFDFQISNVYCWIITLAHNKAIDKLKRTRSINIEAYNNNYELEYIIPKLSPSIDPLDIATAGKIHNNIKGALNNLTEAQQYVIYLAYYGGWTEQEIAERLNIPLKTVKHKIKVALNSLKENILKDNSNE